MEAKPVAVAIAAMFICFGVDLAVIWTDGVAPPVMSLGFTSMGLLVVTAFLAYVTERCYSRGVIWWANLFNSVAFVTGFFAALYCVAACYFARRP